MPITEIYIKINEIPEEEVLTKWFPKSLHRDLVKNPQQECEIFFSFCGARYLAYEISLWKLWDLELLFVVGWKSRELDLKASSVIREEISVHEYLQIGKEIYRRELKEINIKKQKKFLKFTATIPFSKEECAKFESFNQIMGVICKMEKGVLFENIETFFSEKWLC